MEYRWNITGDWADHASMEHYLSHLELLVESFFPSIEIWMAADRRCARRAQDLRSRRYSYSEIPRRHRCSGSITLSRYWETKYCHVPLSIRPSLLLTLCSPSVKPESDRVLLPAGTFVINIRSKSRLGKYDFGANATRIRQFFLALAEALSN